MPNNVNIDPSGNKKLRLKSSLRVRSRKGVPEKSSACTNVHGDLTSTDSIMDSTSAVSSSEPDGVNTKSPSTRASRPQTLNAKYASGDSEQRNIARTFADSVISLLRRTLVSSGDCDSMREGMFLMLVRTYGFVHAQYIAEGLGLPHKKSAALFSMLLFGRDATQSVPSNPRHGPQCPLPSPE